MKLFFKKAFFCTFLISVTAFSQNYSIQWGAYQKVTNRDVFERVVAGDSAGIQVLRSKRTALGDELAFLDFFSGDDFERGYISPLVTQDSYRGTAAKYKTYFENIYRVGNRMVVFMTSYDHEKDRNVAYAQFLDASGALQGELMEVGSMNASRKSNRGNFHFTTSASGNYVLVYNHEPFDKYNDEKFGFTVLDSTLKMVWTNEYTLPYKAHNFIPIEYKVDNHGTAYMLSKVYMTKDQQQEKRLPNSDYYFTMLRFEPEAELNKYDESVFRIEDKYLVNITFRFDSQDDLLLAGYFADSKDMYRTKGIFNFRMPRDGTEPEKYSIYEFGNDFIPEFETDVPMKFGDDGEPEIELTHYVLLEDGSTVLVAEHSLVSETCFTDFRTALTTCNYNYYYNDVFVVKIKPDGSVQWKMRIPKRQMTRNDYGYYSSFGLGLIKDKLVLLYNENPKNLDLKSQNGLYFMTDPRKARVMLVEISAQGQVKKEEFFSNEKRKTWFRPRLSYQHTSSSMVIFSNRLRSYQFGRVSAE